MREIYSRTIQAVAVQILLTCALSASAGTGWILPEKPGWEDVPQLVDDILAHAPRIAGRQMMLEAGADGYPH